MDIGPSKWPLFKQIGHIDLSLSQIDHYDLIFSQMNHTHLTYLLSLGYLLNLT
jgi:hypothetical protein